MIEISGTNNDGWHFWRLLVPKEHVVEGIEVHIHTNDHGISIGDGLITWDEIDEARAALSLNATGKADG